MGYPRDLWFDELVREAPQAEKYRTNLDRMIDEYFSEANDRADLESKLEEKSKEVEALKERLQSHEDSEKITAKRRKAATELLTISYERASTYTNVIISLGYAAIITVFTSNISLLSAMERRVVGVLILFSLLCFISWELFKMIAAGRSANYLAAAVASQDFDEAIEGYNAAIAKQSMTFARFWKWQLFVTIPTGLGAACILIWALFVRLL